MQRYKNIKNKIPDITNLATKTVLNTKINEVKTEIPSMSGLATTYMTNILPLQNLRS